MLMLNANGYTNKDIKTQQVIFNIGEWPFCLFFYELYLY